MTDALVERVVPLVRQLQALQEKTRRLGLLPSDCDLLACPRWGPTKDVLASGHLITSVDVGQPDTGLRFIEPTTEDGIFVCPAWGAEARAQAV